MSRQSLLRQSCSGRHWPGMLSRMLPLENSLGRNGSGQKFKRTASGQCGCFLLVHGAPPTIKTMINIRVSVNFHATIGRKRSLDLSDCIHWNKSVLFGKVHQHRDLGLRRAIKRGMDTASVVANTCIYGSRCSAHQVRQHATHAITKTGHFTFNLIPSLQGFGSGT